MFENDARVYADYNEKGNALRKVIIGVAAILTVAYVVFYLNTVSCLGDRIYYVRINNNYKQDVYFCPPDEAPILIKSGGTELPTKRYYLVGLYRITTVSGRVLREFNLNERTDGVSRWGDTYTFNIGP